MLRNKFVVDALKLFFDPLDLLPRRRALLPIQVQSRRAGQPPMGTVYDGRHHLQVADQFGACSWRGFLLRLPLRFQEQRWIVQNPFANCRRSLPPGGVELARFARIAVMLGKDYRHPLAVLQTLPRHRHQKLHRHLRRDLTFTHLLLDGFRQQLHQRQPPRYPAHAAIEPSRQLIQPVVETLLQLLQQPAHFQRGFVFTHSQRTIQQYGRGFAHRPHDRFCRISPQLFEGQQPFVAIDDYIAVRLAFHCHHHDGRLLAALRQRRQ